MWEERCRREGCSDGWIQAGMRTGMSYLELLPASYSLDLLLTGSQRCDFNLHPIDQEQDDKPLPSHHLTGCNTRNKRNMASSAVGGMSQTMHVLMLCVTIAKLVSSFLGAVYRQIHALEAVDPRDGCITQPLGSVLKSQHRTCLTGWSASGLGRSRHTKEGRRLRSRLLSPKSPSKFRIIILVWRPDIPNSHWFRIKVKAC